LSFGTDGYIANDQKLICPVPYLSYFDMIPTQSCIIILRISIPNKYFNPMKITNPRDWLLINFFLKSAFFHDTLKNKDEVETVSTKIAVKIELHRFTSCRTSASVWLRHTVHYWHLNDGTEGTHSFICDWMVDVNIPTVSMLNTLSSTLVWYVERMRMKHRPINWVAATLEHSIILIIYKHTRSEVLSYVKTQTSEP
jgi:hypothetical protein